MSRKLGVVIAPRVEAACLERLSDLLAEHALGVDVVTSRLDEPGEFLAAGDDTLPDLEHVGQRKAVLIVLLLDAPLQWLVYGNVDSLVDARHAFRDVFNDHVLPMIGVEVFVNGSTEMCGSSVDNDTYPLVYNWAIRIEKQESGSCRSSCQGKLRGATTRT